MIHAHPKPDSAEYGSTDAAWASCFVDTVDRGEAELRARELLSDVGWHSEEVEDAKLVNREQFLDDVDSLEKFDQALVDGVVITLHSWDIGAAGE